MTDTATTGPAVRALWRYPVKSFQGEELSACAVGPRGLEGDRGWALRDQRTGLMLTARRVPELLYAHARYVAGEVAITLPDGTTDPDDAALSAWLGRDVALVRAEAGMAGRYETALDPEHEDTSPWRMWDGPPGSFHDTGHTQVSLVSYASLGTWEARRFRANVLLDTAPGEPETALLGRTVTLGSAMIEVVAPIYRCVITNRPQPGGIARDPGVLRTVARERGNQLGVAAVVRAPGQVAVGDRLSVRPPV